MEVTLPVYYSNIKYMGCIAMIIVLFDQIYTWHTFETALGFFAEGYFARKKKPNLTETNIFPYGELSYGEKSAHGLKHDKQNNFWCLIGKPVVSGD